MLGRPETKYIIQFWLLWDEGVDNDVAVFAMSLVLSPENKAEAVFLFFFPTLSVMVMVMISTSGHDDTNHLKWNHCLHV